MMFSEKNSENYDCTKPIPLWSSVLPVCC